MAGEDDVRDAPQRDDDRTPGAPPVPSGSAPVVGLGEDDVRDAPQQDEYRTPVPSGHGPVIDLGEDAVPNVPGPDDGTPGAPPVLAGPAPVIDLGEDAVPVRPAKPLGPRRLARMQRELAERARELEEAGGPADPELLEKQRRFAELADQAGTVQADPGTAVQDPVAPGPAPAPPSPAPPGDLQEPLEQITVVFPGGGGPGGPDGHMSHDPVHVDPALFSNRLAPEDLAALTHIEIVAPGEAEHHASTPAAPGPAVDHEARGDAEDPPAPPPVPAPAPPEPAPGRAASWPDAEEEPPAPPVPAGAAEGLELLERREYRRRSGSVRWVLLLLAVLAALVVVLVLFVL